MVNRESQLKKDIIMSKNVKRTLVCGTLGNGVYYLPVELGLDQEDSMKARFNMSSENNNIRTEVVRLLKEAHQRGFDNPIIMYLSVHSSHARAFHQGKVGSPMELTNANDSQECGDFHIVADVSRVCTLLREHADKAGAHVADLLAACPAYCSLGWYVGLFKNRMIVAQFKPSGEVWMPESLEYDRAPAVAH